MSHDRMEKLGSLFLVIFSTGLAAQLAIDGALESSEWLGAAAAVLGSISVAVTVRVWPRRMAAAAKRGRD
jgi:hypothetical protein